LLVIQRSTAAGFLAFGPRTLESRPGALDQDVRSNWAALVSTFMVRRPAALVRSVPPSWSQCTFAPILARWLTMVTTSTTFLPRRSNLDTTITMVLSVKLRVFLCILLATTNLACQMTAVRTALAASHARAE
jgi:hypothetical protein